MNTGRSNPLLAAVADPEVSGVDGLLTISGSEGSSVVVVPSHIVAVECDWCPPSTHTDRSGPRQQITVHTVVGKIELPFYDDITGTECAEALQVIDRTTRVALPRHARRTERGNG